MCGVAGFLGEYKGNRGALLSRFMTGLQSRGPDGSDFLDFGWAGVCHTRLALIDATQGGRQPRERSNLVLSFNGEIYNWRNIRDKLSKEGVLQESSSDAETLVNALSHWGINRTLPMLRGIFAFSVLDKVKKELTLVRDQSGTKPMYFREVDSVIFYSSEIKTFSEFGLRIDKDALEEYLSFQNLFGAKSLYQGIKMVEPGTTVTFGLNHSVPVVVKWCENRFSSIDDLDYQESLVELQRLLEQAVERNFVSDFPVGSFLSGGIDSTTLTLIANEHHRGLDTFNIGFESSASSIYPSGNNEETLAGKFASDNGMSFHNQRIGPLDFEYSLDEIVFHLEEPRVGQSYPNFFASKLAKKNVKAVLSGTGADELFGGYPWRYQPTLNLQSKGKESQLAQYFTFWHRLGTPKLISEALKINENSHRERQLAKIRQILDRNSSFSEHYTLDDLLYFEYSTFLPGLLIVEDKLSMAHGLEVRVPYLDQDVVDFARQLPAKYKFRQNLPVGDVVEGKIILRELSRILGNSLAGESKKGFTGNDSNWFRNENRKLVDDRLRSKSSPLWEYLDYTTCIKALDEHMAGKNNSRLFIWSLLSLESVLRQFCVD